MVLLLILKPVSTDTGTGTGADISTDTGTGTDINSDIDAGTATEPGIYCSDTVYLYVVLTLTGHTATDACD